MVRGSHCRSQGRPRRLAIEHLQQDEDVDGDARGGGGRPEDAERQREGRGATDQAGGPWVLGPDGEGADEEEQGGGQPGDAEQPGPVVAEVEVPPGADGRVGEVPQADDAPGGEEADQVDEPVQAQDCLLYTSPSPRD